jgi:ribosome biogenesis GTPase
MVKPATAPARISGRVTAAFGRRYRVELENDGEVDCVACGDKVQVARSGAGTAVIEKVEPRRTLFYRSDARRQKLLAANVTQVVVVLAPVPPYSVDLIDRCLVAAEHAGIHALLALNKSDLPEAASAYDDLELYRKLGYRVVLLSAKRDLSPLRLNLTGHVTLLVGQSGMGKSTIINNLVPAAAARVAEISMALGTGRHTTTHAELYRVDGDSDIIDSPGLQEFGLHHLGPDDAAEAFVEFRPLLGQCRFRNCRHMEEPDCAISAAAGAGSIAPTRLGSYRRLAHELARKPAAWES